MELNALYSKTSPRREGDQSQKQEDEIREENLDKTIEDSFPASDPPSSIPDPEDEEDDEDAA